MAEALVVVGLLSGGKDSCYNLCHCAKQGYRIAALATLAPPEGKDELDSYMYQTVGHDAVHLVAEAMQLPLYRGVISGQALNQTSSYGDRLPSSSAHTLDEADETEDLYKLLCQVKEAQPEINAVSVGAILSNYQRVRVEHVALRAGLQLLPLCYLWQRDQEELLDEMCQAGMESILIKVAGAGLEEKDLGKSLIQMRPKLHKLNKLYGAHICGEGGEYETLTLDCPLFHKRIVIDKTTTVIHSDSSFASVFYLRIDKAHLEEKEERSASLQDVLMPSLLDRLSTSTLTVCEAAGSKPASHPSTAAETLPYTRSAASVRRKRRWCALAGITGVATKVLNDEFQSAFESLENELEQQSLSLAHLAHLNIYLSSQAHFATLNQVYKSFFGVDPPSRACVAVSISNDSDCHVLIDAIAYDDGSRYDCEGRMLSTAVHQNRKVLHVQSRSFWAAANIGPYSQAVNAGGRISIAGQIGLLPVSLRLADSIPTQIALSLQHARRVFKATLEARAEKQLGWIEGCICWIDDVQWLEAAYRSWQHQYNNDEEGWESTWLGSFFQPNDIPLCFVLLSKGSLPRSACIEWQLSAHDGKAATNISKDADADDEDDSEDGEAPFPNTLLEEKVHFAGFEGSHQAVISKQGGSSFGIAHLRQASSAQIDTLSSSFVRILSSALIIKIIYQREEDLRLIKESLLHLDAAKIFLPVCACFDYRMQTCDVVIIWQDV